MGNWLLFIFEYVGPVEFAVNEAICLLVGLLMEIPSGAIADLIGKKKTVSVGILMQFLGSALIVLGIYNKWFIFIGNFLFLGVAFPLISGSFEALAYDTLVENKKEHLYDEIAKSRSVIILIAIVISSAIGGVLWKIDHMLPWVVTAGVFFVAFLFSLALKEPKVDTLHFSFKNFIIQNKVGIVNLLGVELRKFFLILAAVSAVYYAWTTGFINITMGTEFGFDGETLGYMYSVLFLLSALFMHKFKSIRALLGDKLGILILAGMHVVGYFLATFNKGIGIGFLTFLLLVISGEMIETWRTVVINKYIESKDRATTISTLQFFAQIPYVLIVIGFGRLIEEGNTQNFYLTTALILTIVVTVSIIGFYKKKK